jgi:hypothetical protein
MHRYTCRDLSSDGAIHYAPMFTPRCRRASNATLRVRNFCIRRMNVVSKVTFLYHSRNATVLALNAA